jgi:hypothetical protein
MSYKFSWNGTLKSNKYRVDLIDTYLKSHFSLGHLHNKNGSLYMFLVIIEKL